jgi:hypothetical protein
MTQVSRVDKNSAVLVDVAGGCLLVGPSRELLTTLARSFPVRCGLRGRAQAALLGQSCNRKLVDFTFVSNKEIVLTFQEGQDCAVEYLGSDDQIVRAQFLNLTAVKVVVNHGIVYILNDSGKIVATDLSKSGTLKEKIKRLPKDMHSGYVEGEGYTDIVAYKEGIVFIQKNAEELYHANTFGVKEKHKSLTNLKLNSRSRLCYQQTNNSDIRSGLDKLIIFETDPISFANFEKHVAEYESSGEPGEILSYPLTLAIDVESLSTEARFVRMSGSSFGVFGQTTKIPDEIIDTTDIPANPENPKTEILVDQKGDHEIQNKEADKPENKIDSHRFIHIKVNRPYCMKDFNFEEVLAQYEHLCRNEDSKSLNAKNSQQNLYLVYYESNTWKEWKTKKDYDDSLDFKNCGSKAVLEILLFKKEEKSYLPLFSSSKEMISNGIKLVPDLLENTKILIFPDLCSLSPDQWQLVKEHYREHWEPLFSEIEPKYESYRETVTTILGKRLGNSERNRMTPRKAFSSKLKFQESTEFEHHYQDESKWPDLGQLVPVYNGLRLANYAYMHYLAHRPVVGGRSIDGYQRAQIGKNLFPCFDRSTRIKLRFENYVEYHVNRFAGLKVVDHKRQNMALLNQLVYQVFSVAQKDRYYAMVFNQIEMYFVGERRKFLCSWY